MLSKTVCIFSAIILILAVGSLVYAQVQQIYILQRSVIGSTTANIMQGDGYNLNAIVGQPIVGQSSGIGYSIMSGYPTIARIPKIYLPIVLK